eukprot:GHVU01014508.1.p1 GENE.GHVU01014508.1~~GHVU01014508.1.p1  ORF type:complete len:475 (+),score=46.11 GHVU01014508.1:470-1894(+)
MAAGPLEAQEMQGVLLAVLPYAGYQSHYEIARCSRGCLQIVRKYYASCRVLNVPYSTTEGGILIAAAAAHVVGMKAVQSLEKLGLCSDDTYVSTLEARSTPDRCGAIFAELAKSCSASLGELKIWEGTAGFHKVINATGCPKFPVLQTLEVSGDGAHELFVSISTSIAASLRELVLTDRGTNLARLPAEARRGFGQLEAVELAAEFASRAFEQISVACAPSLRKLKIRDIPGDGVPNVMGFVAYFHGIFSQLVDLQLSGTGRGVTTCFALMSRSCGATLTDLLLRDVSADFVTGVSDYFPRLQRVELSGNGGSMKLFAVFSKSCAATLRELVVDDSGFQGDVAGVFAKLEKVEFAGAGATRCFVTHMQSCAYSLRQLEIRGDANRELNELSGLFDRLEDVWLDTYGASTLFASVSESCAGRLRQLRITDYADKFAERIPGKFTALSEVCLRGDGADSCDISVPSTCYLTIGKVA